MAHDTQSKDEGCGVEGNSSSQSQPCGAEKEPLPPVAEPSDQGRDLFTPEDAERFFAKSVGKPYRPANGSEGAMFMGLWCEACTKDNLDPDTGEGGCPIIANTMVFQASDPAYPTEWQWSPRGQPVCTAFDASDTSERSVPARDDLPRPPVLTPVVEASGLGIGSSVARAAVVGCAAKSESALDLEGREP